MIILKIPTLQVPEFRGEPETIQTKLQTSSACVPSSSGMNTTTVQPDSGSVSPNIGFFSRFHKIIEISDFFPIFDSGGQSIFPLLLAFVSASTETMPETTLAWWCIRFSANMFPVELNFKKSAGIV